MIKLPQLLGITLPKWNYSSQTTESLIADNLMVDHEGDMRWMSDEFKQQPLRHFYFKLLIVFTVTFCFYALFCVWDSTCTTRRKR